LQARAALHAVLPVQEEAVVKGSRFTIVATVATTMGIGAMLLPARALAQHTVFVEGNNASNAGPGAILAAPGTAGDYDGDTRIGAAEDSDNPSDGIFGTLKAALAAANGGVNGNGHVVIVTSGRFNEQINLNAVNGVTILEAAPGVEATIDAIVPGDAGNAARLAGAGITVDVPTNDRVVILRNLTIRNFAVGLLMKSRAHVVVENCRFDSNLNANVMVQDGSDLTMTNCSVISAGMRFTPNRNTAAPGDGIVFSGDSRGSISRTTIAYNEGVGIRNTSPRKVMLVPGNNINDNNLADVTGAVAASPF
jgi:hypothetical protein